MSHLNFVARESESYEERALSFINDGFGGSHFLKPILEGNREGFFALGNDEYSQRIWASENGLPKHCSLEKILLTQIEAHATEVFYNLDPVRYPSSFIEKLPSCVKFTVAWNAAPSGGADFRKYDRVVCNFPSILDRMEKDGCNTAYFAPGHDPKLDEYAENLERPIDVLFVGSYSRHHKRRVELLEAVARMAPKWNVRYHMVNSRLTRIAETALFSSVPGLRNHRRPYSIQRISSDPIFGRDLYRELSCSKIVLNGAIDMAGADRGNMRCFEAMGAGCLLLSDEGNYPVGMVNGSTMLTFCDPANAIQIINELLLDWQEKGACIASRGFNEVSSYYSKSRQYEHFGALLA